MRRRRVAGVSFRDVGVPEALCVAARRVGFEWPADVQRAALPTVLSGADAIVQAVSGSGKTCVFALAALHRVCTDLQCTQALIVAPTRELALQCADVVDQLAAALHADGGAVPRCTCRAFVGGLPVEADKAALAERVWHVVVGTPGRLASLIDSGDVRLAGVQLLVLDEADVLVTTDLWPTTEAIVQATGQWRQLVATSATFTDEALAYLTQYGLRSYVVSVADGLPHEVQRAKVDAVDGILRRTPFVQAIVFVNQRGRAELVAAHLRERGWPAVFTAGTLAQSERMRAMDEMRQLRARVLVSTDVVARGLDIDRVGIVVHMDPPWDAETLVHRSGRAGRFGLVGASVFLVTEAELGEPEYGLRVLAHVCSVELVPLGDSDVPAQERIRLDADEQAALERLLV